MSDPWRRRCPEGHTSWRTRGDRYYCYSCEAHFDQLVDAKTGHPVVTDGGTAEHPPSGIEDDATLSERLRAIQLCVHEENYERAEDGLLHALSEVRKRKGGGAADD